MKPTDYLTSDRRGRDAHDLELEAQCDPFVAEALQGLEETPGDHREAVESLRLRIAERAAREARRRRLRRIRQRTAAAAAVLLLLTAGIMTWHRAPVGELPPAVQLADGTVPSTADKQAGEQPATGTAPAGNPSADHRAEARRHPQLQDPADNTDAYPEHPAPDALSTDEFNHIVVTAYGIVHKAPYTGSAKTAGTSNSTMDLTKPGKPEESIGNPAGRAGETTKKSSTEFAVSEPDGSSSRPESGIVDTPGADGTFLVAEIMPEFRGGDFYHTFRQWVQARTRTPGRLCRDTTWQTMRVITSFVIDSTGRLIQPTVLRSPDSQLSRRALRILKRSPRWTPGRQADRPVPVKFTLPVDFHNPNYRPGKPDGPKRPAATQPAGKRSVATQSAGKQPATQPVATQPAREQR